jgi:CO/xanthine dehydrogenase Mo-binding subunit
MPEGPWIGARFIDDLETPDLNFAVTVRSPVPRGRIVSILFPTMPKGYRAILAKDVPGLNKCAVFGTVPLLADSEVFYAGEPVALIAGSDRSVLED